MTTSTRVVSGMFLDPAADRLTIRSAFFEATFQPLAGGRMLSLRHSLGGDLLVPLKDAAFEPNQWPKAGAFPLFPFHNRLRGATFNFSGRSIQVKPNAANGADTMHGPAHRRPWEVTDHSAVSIEMRLAYKADDEWPFDFRATQQFELKNDQLIIALGITNTAQTPAPCGIGWHPYFRSTRDCCFLVDAAAQWHPDGKGEIAQSTTRRPRIKTELPSVDSTYHFSGWTEVSAFAGENARVVMSGEGQLSCLVMHRKANYFCLEPASHLSGALSMLPQILPNSGICILAPGETLSGKAKLHVDQSHHS
jgi:aldose 1-epimerase